MIKLKDLAAERGELPEKLLESCYKLGVSVYYEYQKDEMWLSLQCFKDAWASAK